MTNAEYIYKAVELCWRWYVVEERRNIFDSGIRCMDIEDDFVISTQHLRHGTGPGVPALVAQLKHQTDREQLSSMGQLKELVDSDVVPRGY